MCVMALAHPQAHPPLSRGCFRELPPPHARSQQELSKVAGAAQSGRTSKKVAGAQTSRGGGLEKEFAKSVTKIFSKTNKEDKGREREKEREREKNRTANKAVITVCYGN